MIAPVSGTWGHPDPPTLGPGGSARHFGDGEAACLAIAVARRWTVATDDGDALKALDVLDPGHSYERIRKFLMRAARERLVTRPGANEIHERMTTVGFWDRHRPFP